MLLSENQRKDYEKNGFLFLGDYFSHQEISHLEKELERLPKDAPGTILENDNKTVRALHGCHEYSQVLKSLVQHPRLVQPAQQILNERVYLYQFKVNMKAAFRGDVWPWHQDYTFWYKEDGLPRPEVLNVSIFLDEVNHFNSPLYLIPGSHKYGLIDVEARESNGHGEAPDWQANFSANLKYCLSQNNVEQMAKNRGIVAPVGAKGSVLFFHGNIAHASVPNISPYNRRQIIITYSSVQNIPIPKKQRRPEFLVCRDYTPLQPEKDDNLLQFNPV